jgi:hypothetical protein
VQTQPDHCTYDTHSPSDDSFHAKVIRARFKQPESCLYKAIQPNAPILTIAAHHPFASLTLLDARSMLNLGLLRNSRLEFTFMSSYPPYGPSGLGGVGQRIEEAIEIIELEVRHAAKYVNDAVIPQVRAESITALRNVANSLRSFADRLDSNQTPPANPPKTPGS